MNVESREPESVNTESAEKSDDTRIDLLNEAIDNFLKAVRAEISRVESEGEDPSFLRGLRDDVCSYRWKLEKGYGTKATAIRNIEERINAFKDYVDSVGTLNGIGFFH